MQRIAFVLLTLLTVAMIFLFIPAIAMPHVSASPNQEAAAYSLIAAVNDLRSGNGVLILSENTLLNIAAQTHSEYQAALGYWTHEGPGGSNETDRAFAVGYGGGSSIACDEAVAVASSDKDAAYIVYTLWNDYVHRDVVLLNTKYTEIGAGVAKGSDGLYYYTVDVCVASGGSQISPTQPASQTTRIAPGQTFTPLMTATPREDGSIWHVVQPGEYLFLIAVSYGITELELATMNGISPSNPVIFAGQELLIRRAPTPTVTPTITNTPRPPTRTPRPTITPRPTRETSTPQNTPTLTNTPTPLPPFLQKINSIDQRTWGAIILGVSVIGAVVSLAGLPRHKTHPSNPVEAESQQSGDTDLENTPEEGEMASQDSEC
ncbi:MAG: LysM peptidoglycan-binding domain-containing protein [Anaerolineae bacterium]|nr:LysM peptidoglycan-binding domain-containing protein [Anaerolineae bacterium]